ncbi:MAG: hypothetical protein AAF492_08080 [Verrucomicrobiota bacterium]
METRDEELICKAVDGHATAEELEELEALMTRNPELREELNAQRALGSALARVHLREMQDDVADMFWSNIYNRLERHTGWLLTVIGLVVATGYGLFQLLTRPDIDPVLRGALGILLAGMVLIFGGVCRMHMKVRKKERYREVIR